MHRVMSIFKSFLEYIKATKYNIGFVETPLKDIIEGGPISVNWLRHSYKDRWFADPFILNVTDDEIIALVEEWYDPIQRGRISKLVIDKKSSELKKMDVVLDEGSHLSFPAIERVGEDIYIYPENSITGKLEYYKYNEKNVRFEKVGKLCEQPLTDAVIAKCFGHPLLFSTKLPDANGKELGIYFWNEKRKEFEIKEYCHFTENISRMAGAFFSYEGKIYRPAQVCIKSYGDAVSLQEVSFSQGKWSFNEIRRIYSPNPIYDLGFHTFNVYKDVIVVDALGFRRPKLAHGLRTISKWLK